MLLGQLGHSDTKSRCLPRKIDFSQNINQIQAGDFFVLLKSFIFIYFLI